MAQGVMRRIGELSEEGSGCWLARARTTRTAKTGAPRQIDHDLQVLWDLRRRELAGEKMDLDEDSYDRYTVGPGRDAPG